VLYVYGCFGEINYDDKVFLENTQPNVVKI